MTLSVPCIYLIVQVYTTLILVVKRMVDKSSSVPLYVQIQDALYEQIRGGNLGPGSKAPSELEIAARYNVSRMTARKALEGLVSHGVLYRQRGKGTFVAEQVVFYGLSTMLSFSRTLQTLGYEVTTKVLNQDVIPASTDVAEKLNLRPNSKVVLVRRLRHLDSKPVAIHTSFMDFKVYAPILQVDLGRESLLAAIERVCGTRVAYSKDSVRATLVSSEDMGLLEIPVGSPVLDVEGVAFTDNGQPTRYTKAIYRSDVFRLAVTNSGQQATLLKVADLRKLPSRNDGKAVVTEAGS